jgi:pyruvate,orthophosphate dikinase
VGDQLIPAGALVTVDGGSGALYLGDRRVAGAADVEEVRTIRGWAAELGVEPGTLAAGTAEPASRSVALLELVRTVQLKGLCTAGRAAAALGAGEPALARLMEANASLFRTTPRGYALTPEGRDWLTERLDEERARCDAATAHHHYGRFLLLNDRFKALVTGWQMSAEKAPGGPAWTTMLAAVEDVHGDLAPLVVDVSALVPRLGDYARRFDAALAEIRAGDASMLASPLKGSYHTVWFEYHEELISLTGRNRADESD